MRDYLKQFQLDKIVLNPIEVTGETGDAVEREQIVDNVKTLDINKIPATQDIRNSNLWHFETYESKLEDADGGKSVEEYLAIFELKEGVPYNIEEAKNLEQNSKYSLCAHKVQELQSNLCI